MLRASSSGTSWVELLLSGSQRVIVPVNSTWTFRILVAGRASNDNYYDALVITARANTGDSARWVATVCTSEVKW